MNSTEAAKMKQQPSFQNKDRRTSTTRVKTKIKQEAMSDDDDDDDEKVDPANASSHTNTQRPIKQEPHDTSSDNNNNNDDSDHDDNDEDDKSDEEYFDAHEEPSEEEDEDKETIHHNDNDHDDDDDDDDASGNPHELHDQEGNPKPIVYGGLGIENYSDLDMTGTERYREMLREWSPSFQKGSADKRNDIMEYFYKCFTFQELDGTPTPFHMIRNRLRSRLHAGYKGTRSGSSSNEASPIKTTRTMPTREKRKRSSSATSMPGAPTVSTRPDRKAKSKALHASSRNNDTDNESLSPAPSSTTERPRKRIKTEHVGHEALNLPQSQDFVPPAKMLTVHGGTGNYAKEGNVQYKKFIDARRLDYMDGKRNTADIVQECLTYFSFVSPEKQRLDHDDAAAKIAKDLATRPRKDSSTSSAKRKGSSLNAPTPTSMTLHPDRGFASALTATSQPTLSAQPLERPIVWGGTGVSTKEGNLLYLKFMDERRVRYMQAKDVADKATQDEITDEIAQSFRFVNAAGEELAEQEIRTKIYKNIADRRILDAMLRGKTKARVVNAPSVTPRRLVPKPPPYEPEIPKESTLLAEYDSSPHFVEELAYHALASEELDIRVNAGETDFQMLQPIPPPEALPTLPVHQEGRPKYSFYNDYCYTTEGFDCRIIHVDCTGLDRIQAEDKAFIGSLMQRNDIHVLFEGLCRGLSPDELLMEFKCCATPGPANKVRRFDKVTNDDGHAEYVEQDKTVGISVDEFFKYLKILQDTRKGGTAASEFTFRDQTENEDVTIDPSETVLYMTDIDLTDRARAVDRIYKSDFLLPEILPGGDWCMMNSIPTNSCPFMGPNLYITPGGGYTQIHQDGHGTVDSGHSCISGYNEVIMLRRLPEQHKLRACSMMPSREHVSPKQQANNMLYNLPHADKRKDKPAWPTKATIDEMNRSNYCVSVFTLRENQHLHIPQGCLHAFRKLTNDPLPLTDCHYDIRAKIVKEKGLVETGSPLCVSIAFDWMFIGLDAEAVNKSTAACMECQTLTRQFETAKPLGIPETCLLYLANRIKNFVREGNGVQGISRMDTQKGRRGLKETARGVLPCLRYVAERDALDRRGISPSPYLTLLEPDDRTNEGSVNPYGGDGFRCNVCSIELAHAYFRCDGCEYSGRDFNLCTDCYINRKYIGTNHYENCSGGPGVAVPNGKCGCRELKCDNDGCGRLKPCSCTCHQYFHRRTRFFTDDEVREFIAAAQTLAGDKEVKYHEETLMRLNGKVMVRPGETDEYMKKMKAAHATAEKKAQAKGGSVIVQPTANFAQPSTNWNSNVSEEELPGDESNPADTQMSIDDEGQAEFTTDQVHKPSADRAAEEASRSDENGGPGKPQQDSEGKVAMDVDENHDEIGSDEEEMLVI